MVAALSAATILLWRDSDHSLPVMTFWGLLAGVLLWGVLGHLTGANRYTDLPVAPGKVLVLIPTYNELNDNVHATVRSVLAQTVECDVIVVDDGSVIPVEPFLHPRVRWIRQDNSGKRKAQITGLFATERNEYQFVLTVDGDSAPHPTALEHLLRAMSDPEVWAATGWVITRNYRDNWISRCADLDIGIAMVMNRSSRTQLGAIETMSGALALYRADLLWDEAEEYLSDNVGAGDDRWLTARALLRGKAVGVNEAIVDTDMPTQVGRTLHQRVRWCKSTYLMAGYSVARYRAIQLIPPVINFIYIATAPLAFAALVAAEIYNARRGYPLIAVTRSDLAVLLAVGVLSKICLCALYLLRRPNMSGWQKMISMCAAGTLLFAFGVFSVIVPKYWAVFQLRKVRWTTREVKGHLVVVPAKSYAAERKPGRRQRADDAPQQPALAEAVRRRVGDAERNRRRDFDSTAVMQLVDLSGRSGATNQLPD
jgi:cellulose synthase/poly-beta-1,6-N-acetylglucosamine synthase-like glycosyltransferase